VRPKTAEAVGEPLHDQCSGLDARTRSSLKAGLETDTVRLGLEALVRHSAHERLRALRGSDPRARETPADVSALQHSIMQLHDRLG
jgi:hypothetical protein